MPASNGPRPWACPVPGGERHMLRLAASLAGVSYDLDNAAPLSEHLSGRDARHIGFVGTPRGGVPGHLANPVDAAMKAAAS